MNENIAVISGEQTKDIISKKKDNVNVVYISKRMPDIDTALRMEQRYKNLVWIIGQGYNSRVNLSKDETQYSIRSISADWIKKYQNIDILDRFNINNSILMFGMSHLQGMMDLTGGIDNVSIIAAPSLDIFLYNRYIKRICETTSKKDRKKIRKVIFEFPYYIFNYDLSKTKTVAFQRFSYFYYIHEYHNLVTNDLTEKFIENFDIINRLFDKDPINFLTEPQKKNLLWIRKLHGKVRIVTDKYSVWKKRYIDTINENIILFEKIYKLLVDEFPNCSIEIIVTPFNPLFRFTHKKEIKEKKELFYKVINNYDIKIDDKFNFLKSGKYFLDYCHLNYDGAVKYRTYLTESGIWEL